jgi:hypothetical protein
LNNSR